MSRSILATFLAVSVLTLGSSPLSAAKFNKNVDIGDKPAAWKDLKGVDGKTHSLSDYKDAELLVIAFICNHCVVAEAYQARFNEFAEAYKDKKVRLVAISVSNLEADSLENMTARAKEKGYKFDYLQDLSQETGRAYGALVTPHLYVLDKDRKIAYMGAFDNSMNPDKVEKHYLKDAVDALIKGNEPEVKESLQFGCGIQYKPK